MSETVPKASLGILCDLVAGGTPSTSDLSLWSDDPVVGHPWIAIGDMSRRKNVSSTMKHVSDKGLEKARLPVGEPGTVLFAIYASVGETAILDIRATWNQAILGLSPKDKTKLDSKFLYYALLTLRPELPIHYRSNTQHNLNAETVSRLQIPLPSLETQRRIADWLDRETGEIDAMIDKLDEMAETLRTRRQSAIDEVFLNNLAFAPLWTLTKGVIDCPHTTPVVDDTGEYEAVRTASIRDGKYLPGNGIRVSEETARERNGDQPPEPGDVFFTREAPAGEACIVPEGNFCLGQRMVLIKPNHKKLDSRFLLYAIYTSSNQREMELSAGGSTVVNLKLGTIRSMSIPAMAITQQRRIADHLDDVTSKIAAMLAKVAELKNLLTERRAALITDVVSGRKDVA